MKCKRVGVTLATPPPCELDDPTRPRAGHPAGHPARAGRILRRYGVTVIYARNAMDLFLVCPGPYVVLFLVTLATGRDVG